MARNPKLAGKLCEELEILRTHPPVCIGTDQYTTRGKVECQVWEHVDGTQFGVQVVAGHRIRYTVAEVCRRTQGIIRYYHGPRVKLQWIRLQIRQLESALEMSSERVD